MKSKKIYRRLPQIEGGKNFPGVYVDTQWLNKLTPNRVHFEQSAMLNTFDRLLNKRKHESDVEDKNKELPKEELG